MVNTKLDISICGPTSVFHFDPHPLGELRTELRTSPRHVVMRQGLLRFCTLELDLAPHPAQAPVGVAHPLDIAGAIERNT